MLPSVDHAYSCHQCRRLPQRLHKLTYVAKNRTNRVKFVFENPSNTNNVWAALRTFDSFGVHEVDIIMDVRKKCVYDVTNTFIIVYTTCHFCFQFIIIYSFVVILYKFSCLFS